MSGCTACNATVAGQSVSQATYLTAWTPREYRQTGVYASQWWSTAQSPTAPSFVALEYAPLGSRYPGRKPNFFSKNNNKDDNIHKREAQQIK